MINPLPAVLVTCGDTPEKWNMITVAWTGTICTDPAMCYISVRPERASYPVIERTMEFTINLTHPRRKGEITDNRRISAIHRMPRQTH